MPWAVAIRRENYSLAVRRPRVWVVLPLVQCQPFRAAQPLAPISQSRNVHIALGNESSYGKDSSVTCRAQLGYLASVTRDPRTGAGRRCSPWAEVDAPQVEVVLVGFRVLERIDQLLVMRPSQNSAKPRPRQYNSNFSGGYVGNFDLGLISSKVSGRPSDIGDPFSFRSPCHRAESVLPLWFRTTREPLWMAAVRLHQPNFSGFDPSSQKSD